MARKNKASETTNNKNPKFNPFCTAMVWAPKKVPSAIMSLNHNTIVIITITVAMYNTI